jgi:hypothetical protein
MPLPREAALNSGPRDLGCAKPRRSQPARTKHATVPARVPHRASSGPDLLTQEAGGSAGARL